MKQYLDACRYVLENGIERNDRTGTGTISCFGYQTRYNLEEGFPLLTTKKVFFKAIVYELLWFIHGRTDLRYLANHNVKIWNEWPYKKFCESDEYHGESMEEFIQKIINDDEFNDKFGDLGPIYGKQWRDFDGNDQLSNIINELKTNPFSRRLIISAWHPGENEKMALMPCHTLMQFYVSPDQKKLSLQLYQRSADLFLGVPFNIASYSLLLMMVAKVCGYQPYEMVHTFGDIHIYKDHLDQIHEQLSRDIRPLPKVEFARDITNIEDFEYEDIILKDYNPHGKIVGKVSV